MDTRWSIKSDNAAVIGANIQPFQSLGKSYQSPQPFTTPVPEIDSLHKTIPRSFSSSSLQSGFFLKYELKEAIGTGSTSKVFRAIRKSDGVSVACKVIEKPQAKGEEYSYLLQQYLEEVKILELLKHPNIISLEDSYETIDRIYVVMELMEGGELFDYIIEKVTLCESEAVDIIRKILSAVAYMHSKNVLHRDLKPENLLLATKGTCSDLKIIDFGLAKMLPDAVSAASFLGSKGYLAPELLQRNTYGMSVDVWAVGVIAFVLLCGCLPFNDDNKFIENTPSAAMLQFTLHFPSWSSELSSSSKDLLRRLLDINPKTRITASEALEHPWLLTPVYPHLSNSQNLLPSPQSFVSQPDLLRMSPNSLLQAVKQEKREIAAMNDFGASEHRASI